MAKKVKAIIKLQIEAGKATPAPPVGPALGQHGVNIMSFVKEYNERTASQQGNVIPVELTVFEDTSFTGSASDPGSGRLEVGIILDLHQLISLQLIDFL